VFRFLAMCHTGASQAAGSVVVHLEADRLEARLCIVSRPRGSCGTETQI
jgi:hypothetical protein